MYIPLLDSVAGGGEPKRDESLLKYSDSDNERISNSNTNWPRFLLVESSSDDLPLSKLLPSAIWEGISGNSRDPQKHQKTEGWIFPDGMR